MKGYRMLSAGDLFNNLGRLARTLMDYDALVRLLMRGINIHAPGNHDYLPGVLSFKYHNSSFYRDGSRLITHGTGVGSPDKFYREDGPWPRFRRRLGEGIVELGDWSERRLHKDIDNWVMRGLKCGHDVVVPRGRRIDDEAWIRYGVELIVERLLCATAPEVILGHTHRAMIVRGCIWMVNHELAAFEIYNHNSNDGRAWLYWNNWDAVKLNRLSTGQSLEWHTVTIYNCGAWVPSNETYQVAGTSTTIQRGEVGAFVVRWEDDGPSEFLRWQGGELREVV
jgi:hypothetical protein